MIGRFKRLLISNSSLIERSILTALAILLSFLFAVNGWTADVKDLTNMSLEDLILVEVASVSKKTERFFEAPAAIFVITQEDIRRSGTTTIPDALRMVPEVEVAQIDSNNGWNAFHTGFRLDCKASSENTFTLQGDVYREYSGSSQKTALLTSSYTITLRDDFRGEEINLLDRRTHPFSETSGLTFQGYYDHTGRHDLLMNEDQATIDLDLQDEITLAPDRLRWTIGAKLEHNDYWQDRPAFLDRPIDNKKKCFFNMLQKNNKTSESDRT